MNQSTLYSVVKGIYRLHSTLKQLADLLIPLLELDPVAALQVEGAALGVGLVPLRCLGGGHDPEPVDHVGNARLELQDGEAVSDTFSGSDGEPNLAGGRVPGLLVLLAEVLGVEGCRVREESLIHGDAAGRQGDVHPLGNGGVCPGNLVVLGALP